MRLKQRKDMEEFLMIFRNDKNEDGEKPSAEQMQAVMNHWQNWIGSVAAQGNYVSTNRLHTVGRTLKPGNVAIDGPYAEVKEMIGGYLIVKANNFEEAMKMAEDCPNLVYGGSVEVRPVLAMEVDMSSTSFLKEK